jgi:hypothetical protein
MKDLSNPRPRLMTRQFALVWAITFVTFFFALRAQG